ncbi:4-hydroxymandelate oxidase [Nocardioides aquaticus]|uniref:4-hydroxymandelate oxidase n=1 Tax=Nocardioides aquaticus TaxID=160826 RepID=A0ABX8EHS9_9ACTN|nr:alpha-hydroxy acid oxidase [Nocardioides aquaticus]QVT79657.1 4-hydroxymandelate oxidase [Nocardioides aquaticus]
MSEDARWLAGLGEQARARLPREVYDYVAQGAREGVTAGEAAWAWHGHRLHPHVLRDVTDVDLSVPVLDGRAGVPWGIAPTTLQGAVHPDGELAVARATAEVDGLMVLTSNAGVTVEEVAATGVRWWLQAYLPSDRTLAIPLLRRAVAAGAGAVVLTVDTPVVATKYAAERAAVERRHPDLVGTNLELAAPNAEKALDLGPHDLDWLRELTGLPVVVKGVLRADDAVRCVQAGAAAVWVSNHGGRQLDRAVATAAALPDVVAAVGGRAQVYVDGGVRSGIDVVTALALGADAVFLGRPVMWALVEGELGVARMHREIGVQTVETLRLAGCSSVSDARGLASPAGLRSLAQAADLQ